MRDPILDGGEPPIGCAGLLVGLLLACLFPLFVIGWVASVAAS